MAVPYSGLFSSQFPDYQNIYAEFIYQFDFIIMRFSGRFQSHYHKLKVYQRRLKLFLTAKSGSRSHFFLLVVVVVIVVVLVLVLVLILVLVLVLVRDFLQKPRV